MSSDQKHPNGQTEKREPDISDIKYLGTVLDLAGKNARKVSTVASIAITTLTAFIIGIGLFSFLTLEDEKDRLESRMGQIESSLKDEIKATLGLAAKRPDVQLLTVTRKDLDGQTVTAKFTPGRDKETRDRITFPIILLNKGKGVSDQIFLKVYSKGTFKSNTVSTDEPDFDYEWMITPFKFPYQPAILPADCSVGITIKMDTLDYNRDLETHSMLIKVYFGEEHANQARFNLEIAE